MYKIQVVKTITTDYELELPEVERLKINQMTEAQAKKYIMDNYNWWETFPKSIKSTEAINTIKVKKS